MPDESLVDTGEAARILGCNETQSANATRKPVGQTCETLVIQIELWPVDRLIPSDLNPRTHSREQVAQIAASIREFGFVNPILVGPDGEIIAGEGRLRAARTLRMREVPVIVLGHLSESQRRALAIADNQLALNAGWDE